MHFTAPFEATQPDALRAIMDRLGHHAMAHVISSDPAYRPVSSFLPVNFNPAGENSQFGSFLFHAANPNSQTALLRQSSVTLIEVMSENLYISPSWLTDRNRAPTNIHVAIQCYGRPEPVDSPEGQYAVMTQQVESREQGRTRHWNLSELDEAGLARRMNAVTAFHMPVDEARASVRMLQDESLENVLAVLSHLRTTPELQWAVDWITFANAERLST